MRSATKFVMVLFGVLGLFQVVMFWDGLIAWVRFCAEPYAQIKGTPYHQMWTSLRAVGGILLSTVVMVWLIVDWRTSKHPTRRDAEEGAQGTTRRAGR
jgi:uncharacterized membrane protein